MFDFRKFYTEQVRARLEGRWTSGQFLLPFGDGTDRDAWGETVPADAAKVADEARSKILGGWSPFAGEIRDNKGTVKVASGHTMSETEIYNWNWPIDGISGL
jgi:hypothetical protein